MKRKGYTEKEFADKMAKFEARLKPRKKIVAYLREVTDNPSLYFEQEEDPPTWVKKMADVMITAEIVENDYLRLMDDYGNKGAMPNWANAVININTNSITHLDQINWQTATAGWRTDVTKAIVECLECDALKVPVVECMLGQWREATDGELTFDFGQPFDRFCIHLIANIRNHDLYSIEAIKARRNDRLNSVEDRVSRLELPKELQSDDTKNLLQKANGIIGQENTSPTSKKHVSKRGRPNKNFQDIILDEKETSVIMDGLACLLSGKTGKNAVLIIACAIKMGLIGKPTYNAFNEAFKPDGVSKSNYNKYLDLKLYSPEEIDGMIEAIRQKIDSLEQ